jgi:hypothetical protein
VRLAPVIRAATPLIALALVVALGPSAAAATPAPVAGRPVVQRAGPHTLTVRGSLASAGRRTAYHFAYRRPGHAWSRTPPRAVQGRRRQAVTATLTGLDAGALYTVRLVVTTCGGCRSGTARGPQRAFRTQAAPVPPAAPRPPARALPPAQARPAETFAAPPPQADATPTRTPEPAPGPAEEPIPAPGPAPAAGTYRNPVWAASEFPDPTIIRAGSSYYAYATGERFQVMRSPDLIHWERLAPALTARPSWAVAGGDWHPWAPSVLPTTSPCPGATSGGCYLLFYVALSDRSGPAMTNCVAVATSSTPEGPFSDRGPLERADGTREGGWPIGCGDEAGYGNIDPQPFVDDDGRAWLYVSTDWKCTDTCRLAPEISVIPLADDRVRASGRRQPLLAGQAGSWEQAPWAPVVENPWLVKRGGVYHLLYSGGSWQGAYGMGHATASSPVGPFTRTSTSPWTTGTDAVRSVGGGAVVRDATGAEWLAYHGRAASLDGPRTLRIDPLGWSFADRPQVDGPSTDAHSAPAP